jgi:hypothetical protein
MGLPEMCKILIRSLYGVNYEVPASMRDTQSVLGGMSLMCRNLTLAVRLSVGY